MARFLIFPVLLCLCGCTTVEFVRKDITPVKQGILRHSPPSNPDNEKKYKEEVNKQAETFCAGGFTIVREYQAMDEGRSAPGVATGFGFGTSSGSSVFVGSSTSNRTMFNFVEFRCGK